MLAYCSAFPQKREKCGTAEFVPHAVDFKETHTCMDFFFLNVLLRPPTAHIQTCQDELQYICSLLKNDGDLSLNSLHVQFLRTGRVSGSPYLFEVKKTNIIFPADSVVPIHFRNKEEVF